MYETSEPYLYELIEDYKEAGTGEEKEAVFHSLCSAIWASGCKRRIYTKSIRFKVRKDLQDTELGQLFGTWSDLTYHYYRSRTSQDSWSGFIRQKINNLYTRYFDREVILEQEYMELLKTPKRLYYKWSSGAAMEAAEVSEEIEDALRRSEEVRRRLESGKMELPWSSYKKLMEGFLRKCLEHCKRIEEYEEKSALSSRPDFLTEDHFYVSYFNRCLDGELKKWLKKQCGLPQNSRKGYKRCRQCRTLIENSGNKKMYCEPCARLRKRASNQASDQRYKNRRRENRNPLSSL